MVNLKRIALCSAEKQQYHLMVNLKRIDLCSAEKQQYHLMVNLKRIDHRVGGIVASLLSTDLFSLNSP
jgi:hypothetical protein